MSAKMGKDCKSSSPETFCRLQEFGVEVCGLSRANLLYVYHGSSLIIGPRRCFLIVEVVMLHKTSTSDTKDSFCARGGKTLSRCLFLCAGWQS